MYATGTKSTKLKSFLHFTFTISQNVLLTVSSTYQLNFDFKSLPYIQTAKG
jgi:hypothetical protein